MHDILYPTLAALSVMAISLIGVIFLSRRLGTWIHRHLTYLATFAAGVFIIVAWHLAEEAIHEGGWIVGLGAMLVGAALMESINFFFPAHHHHDTHHDHAHNDIDGRRVLLSDALHNIGDGILIVAAFSADLYIGIATTIGVLLHELVQETSEFFVLKESGYSDTRALTMNFSVSSTILVGLFLAFFLSSVEIVVAVLAGLAAGGFMSVLLHDLLPHALASIKTHGRAYIHLITLVAGAALMFGVQAFASHEEIEEHIESDAETPVHIEGSMNAAFTPPAPTAPVSSPTPVSTEPSAEPAAVDAMPDETEETAPLPQSPAEDGVPNEEVSETGSADGTPTPGAR